MNILNNITDAIGNTPMVKLNRLATDLPGNVYVKMESHNPLGSVKDRIGLSMIKAGEDNGLIKEGTEIIEATSGNTGVALAYVCAARGYKCTLCMPESMSLERRHLLNILGANLILTPPEKGMPGAVAKATEMHEANPNSYMPQQFNNEANPDIHSATTAEEIWADTDGNIDALVSGVGTGGTLTGIARVLKKRNPEFKAIAVEPEGSPVISGGQPGPHKVQGIGAGFIPNNLDTSLIDDIILINEENAGNTARQVAKQEGLLVGISSGGNIWAAIQLAKRPEMAGKNIVTIACDTGERYLSTWLFEEARP